MRVAVIGGGPAGLATAALLRREGVADEVVLWERNRPQQVGFGVIIPPEVVTAAARIGSDVGDGLREAAMQWHRVTVRRGKEAWSTPAGPKLAAVARSTFNGLLWDVCTESGVLPRIGPAPSVDALARTHDMVVCADGAGSLAASAGFDVEVRGLGLPYMWLGLDEAVGCLEFSTETTVAGTYTAHAYPYSPSASTFLVEGPSPLSATDVSALFGRTVRRAPGQDAFGWRSFRERTVRPWSIGNVVLVGDAAHTAHYSIGSGTALALEDALVLVDALADRADLDSALRRYEASRRPVVERTQTRGRLSAEWFSLIDEYLGLAANEFALSLLTRGGRLTDLDGEQSGPHPGDHADRPNSDEGRKSS